MLLVRLGWRNLWRSPRRSALTIAAVAVAFGVLVILDGLREGLARQMLENGTRFMLGHLQVHDGAYLPDRGLHDTLGGEAGADVPRLLAAVAATADVRAAAPRVFGFGLLSTGPRSAGAQLLGVDPGREARVTSLLATVTSGTGLETAPPGSVLLGRALAEELGAQAGDRVAVVTLATDGSIGNEMLTVAGVFETGLVALDRTLAVLRIEELQALLALSASRIHEIAVRTRDPAAAAAVAGALAASGTLPPGSRVHTWERLAPALADYLRLGRAWSWVTVAIVGLLAALGVLNTMLMAVFERTRELGMLASLGLRPTQVLAMVLAESLGLAAVGIVLGSGLGALGMAYLAVHGWDLSRWTAGLTIAAVLVDPVLRGAWTWHGAARTAVALAVLAGLAGLGPAVRAARMKPVDALAAPVD